MRDSRNLGFSVCCVSDVDEIVQVCLLMNVKFDVVVRVNYELGSVVVEMLINVRNVVVRRRMVVMVVVKWGFCGLMLVGVVIFVFVFVFQMVVRVLVRVCGCGILWNCVWMVLELLIMKVVGVCSIWQCVERLGWCVRFIFRWWSLLCLDVYVLRS